MLACPAEAKNCEEQTIVLLLDVGSLLKLSWVLELDDERVAGLFKTAREILNLEIWRILLCFWREW
jgi:hypothetical protein